MNLLDSLRKLSTDTLTSIKELKSRIVERLFKSKIYIETIYEGQYIIRIEHFGKQKVYIRGTGARVTNFKTAAEVFTSKDSIDSAVREFKKKEIQEQKQKALKKSVRYEKFEG